MYDVLNLGLKLAIANFQPFLLTSAIAPFLIMVASFASGVFFLG